MRQKFAFFLLLLAALACSLPFSGETAIPGEPTLDIATLVAQNMTAVAEGTLPVPLPATETPIPEPVRTNLVVVYARGGNILLSRLGATPQTLTTTGQDSSPRISDDGQLIAFLRNGELYSVRADGTAERPLVTAAYMDTFRTSDMLSVRIKDFGFIPNSHEILFSLYGETEAFPAYLNDLQRINADGGPVVMVIPPGSGGGEWTFSPDGRYFALSQGDRIRVFSSDGSGDRTVFSFEFVSTYSEWVYYPEVVWRNDSAGFYTVVPASAALDDTSEPTRYYYVPLMGEPARLAEFVAVPVWMSFPFLAPNGLSVAYVSETGGMQSLHVIDASTADRVYNSAAVLGILNWNPDSLRVAYYAGEPSGANLLAFGAAPLALNDASTFSGMRWVSGERYLFLDREDLRLRELPGASVLIDSGVSTYDFVLLP